MKTGERGVAWLSAEAAAIYVGYVNADGTPKMRAFYEWVRTERARTPRRLRVYRLGDRQLRFRAADLDRCIEAEPEADAVPAGRRLRMVGGGR